MNLIESANKWMNESIDKIFYHGSPYNFDKFSFDNIGTGDELTKYGYGLYFTEDKELAEFYARELSIGDKIPYIYEVKLSELNNYQNWDDEMSYSLYDCVINTLEDMGFDDDVQLMKDEYEEYGDLMTVDSLYSQLTYILGGQKETTKFLYDCDLSGVITDVNVQQSHGKVFVAYSDEIVKIIRKYKLNEGEYDG